MDQFNEILCWRKLFRKKNQQIYYDYDVIPENYYKSTAVDRQKD